MPADKHDHKRTDPADPRKTHGTDDTDNDGALPPICMVVADISILRADHVSPRKVSIHQGFKNNPLYERATTVLCIFNCYFIVQAHRRSLIDEVANTFGPPGNNLRILKYFAARVHTTTRCTMHHAPYQMIMRRMVTLTGVCTSNATRTRRPPFWELPTPPLADRRSILPVAYSITAYRRQMRAFHDPVGNETTFGASGAGRRLVSVMRSITVRPSPVNMYGMNTASNDNTPDSTAVI